MRHQSRLLVFCVTLALALSIVVLRTASSAPTPQSQSYSNITPTDLVGATNTGPTITTTANGGNGRSTQALVSGNGGMRFTNTQPTCCVPVRAGLQFGTWDGTATDIDFRWSTYGDYAYAMTTQTGGGVYSRAVSIGDILEVRIVGTSVVWYVNGNSVWTETSWGVPKQTISRDGKFIAFTSNWGNSGRTDLFVAKITPAPTGLGITPRAQDTFNYYTAASSGIGTNIAGHAAGVGGTWGLHPIYSASSPRVSDYHEVGFAARGTATGHALTLLNTAVPVSDYKVMTICSRITIVGTGNMRCGAAARFSNPTNTGLIASWKESGFVKLDQYVNGSATELGSYTLAVDDYKTHHITLQVSGTTVTVWVDGIAAITATTSITGAGYAGFITGENTTDGQNGTYVRDFLVTSN